MGKSETREAYFGGSDSQRKKESIKSRVLPILFNTEMARAILDYRKKATRRLVMPHNRKKAKEQGYCQGYGLYIDFNIDNLDGEGHIKDYSISDCWMRTSIYIQKYAPYRPGDILYVRETWAFMPCIGCNGEYARPGSGMNCYDTQAVEYDDGESISDGCFVYRADCRNPKRIIWRPSIHMPREAARIWLKVTDVRVERLQDMDGYAILQEGVNCHVHPEAHYFDGNQKMMFAELWDSTIGKTDLERYGWDANPWVWVIEFERCRKSEEL